jgi:hypothetical protein
MWSMLEARTLYNNSMLEDTGSILISFKPALVSITDVEAFDADDVPENVINNVLITTCYYY